MNDLQCHRWSELTATPWKNGGGVTRELAREITASAPSWRLSIADLEQPGPFSVFESWQRYFGVLGENPVILTFSDRDVRLSTGDMLVFDGREPVTCLLPNGASRALNLMLDPAQWCGKMVWCEPREGLVSGSRAESWYVVARGRLRLEQAVREGDSLGPGDSVRWLAQGEVSQRDSLGTLGGSPDAAGFGVRLVPRKFGHDKESL